MTARRRGVLGGLLVLLTGFAVLLLPTASARAQTLGDRLKGQRGAPPDSTRSAPPSSWTVVAGEIAAGTALAVGVGYGVGQIGEAFRDDVDGGKPGGDTPGIALGTPLGALLGVWLVGRGVPPSGRFGDTALGALAGAAIFGAYVSLLEDQSPGVRWVGIVAPAAVATLAWNRSRTVIAPELSLKREPGPRVLRGRTAFPRPFAPVLTVDLAVARLRF